MTISQYRRIGGLLTALLVGSFGGNPRSAAQDFRLARVVPADVFLLVGTQHNPERAFIDEYWDSVVDSFKESGIGDDVLQLVSSLLNEEQRVEMDRLKQRVTDLINGVDWVRLLSGETAFTERMCMPIQSADDINMGPPDMVGLFRPASGDAAQADFEGLVAILKAVVDEVNRAAGAEVLALERGERLGAQVAACNLQNQQPGAPPLMISVARRDDLVAVALGEGLLNDVLALLNGSSAKQPLAEDPRFKKAFGSLSPPEDTVVFFDMNQMIKPFRRLLELIVTEMGLHDVIVNNTIAEEAGRLNTEAMAAYHRGDAQQALALVGQAHEVDDDNSIILYNLACFSALANHPDEALAWLEKAVEGGFHAPKKISHDRDLVSVHDDPRFEAVLKRAKELAASSGAEDTVINSTKAGEAYKLSMQAYGHHAQQDYEQGLRLLEQAQEIAPGDSKILYDLACFHALLGHPDKALDFLERAVRGGFYCPHHIADDQDLQSIRGQARYGAALAEARSRATERSAGETAETVETVQRVVTRLIDAFTIMDYTATTVRTEGHSVVSDSIAVLAPDADKRPIYPMFQGRSQLAGFENFLPKETQSFWAWEAVDLLAAYRFIKDTFRAAGPKGEELLAKWEELQSTFGVNLENDVLAWLDGEVIAASLENGQGFVLLVKVNDEQQARKKIGDAIDFLVNQLTQAIPNQPFLAMLKVETSPAEHDNLPGFESLRLAVSPEPLLVWGVAESRVIIGHPAAAVSTCLETARGRHPNIRQNSRVVKEALLPDGPAALVSLEDQRGMGENLAAMFGGISMASGMVIMSIPDPQLKQALSRVSSIVAKLSPVVRQINFFKSTATQVTFDGKVWRTQMVMHYLEPEERAKLAVSGAAKSN